MEQKCPKCGSRQLSPNEDGDIECLCGKILYSHIASPLPARKKAKLVTKEAMPVTEVLVSDQYRTRVEFFNVPEKVWEPIVEINKPREGKPSERLGHGLSLLKEVVVTAFAQDYQKRVLEYSNCKFDAYMETLTERSDLEEINKMLYRWIKYLDTLPDCQHTRGAAMVLLSLAELCSTIDKMRPAEVESEVKLLTAVEGEK